MSFGLCGPMSAFAQSGQEDGWQNLEDFLNQAERVIERQEERPAVSETQGQESFDPQALGAGDIITMDIAKVPDLSQNYTIDKNGEIDFPLIGRVNVQEETPENLAAKLAVLYETDYLVNPAITVSIFAKRLPTVRPATPLTSPVSEVIESKPFALTLSNPAPAAESIQLEDIIEAEPLIEPRPENVPLALPAINSEAAAPITLPEALPEPPSEPIEIAALSAPALPVIGPETPAPVIAQETAPLPISLADTRWSIEGSSDDFIHFLEGGDMAGALSCNSFFARYDAGQSEINISAPTTTAIPCADQSKPQEFIDNLKQAKNYLYSQDALLLLDDRSDVIFVLQPK